MSTLRVTQARVTRSEWTKLRTQPGALWSLLSTVILIVAFGILYSLLRAARPPHGATASSFDPVSVSLSGVQLAQIAAGVLGVLLITSEYASGLIRTTLAAVPRRLPTLWGKAAVLAAWQAKAIPLYAVVAAPITALNWQDILAGRKVAPHFLTGGLADEIGKYLPGAAGLAVTSVHPDPATSLAPWTGFGVFCAYAVVLLGFAAMRMRRGDV